MFASTKLFSSNSIAVLIGSVIAVSDNMAYAGGDKHKKKSNDAFQDTEQFSGTAQDSTCGCGNDTLATCNNVAWSFNLNGGNNALGQQ